jgi:hypothetical protein
LRDFGGVERFGLQAVTPQALSRHHRRESVSTISLRLPESLHKQARELAKKDNVSINQLITTALAEKLSALLTLSTWRSGRSVVLAESSSGSWPRYGIASLRKETVCRVLVCRASWGAGVLGTHTVPRNEAIKEILDWLDRYLGPVS